MTNVLGADFRPGLGPAREQNLFVGISKHLYLLRDGTLKYQQKDLDPRTAGARELLARYVLLDVDTGALYGEYHPLKDRKDLAGFLARAWHVKDKSEIRGLPQLLNVPNIVRSDPDYLDDLIQLQQWGDFDVGELPSGFAGGIHAVKQFERSVDVLCLRRADGLEPDLELLQAMSGMLSAYASSSIAYLWQAKWQDVPPPPAEFFAKVDALYEEPGAWRLEPKWALVLQGIDRE